MAKEERSRVRRRRRGCLGGCLTNLLLTLGLAALVFVGACVLGFVAIDPQTGKPALSMSGAGIEGLSFEGAMESISGVIAAAPDWAYGVEREGMTIKTLRAGKGEAILVCCDGYTMLVGAGSGSGVTLCGQMLLCGVNRLDAAAALSSGDTQLGGMKAAIALGKPGYLLLQDSQVKGAAYNRMISAAQDNGAQIIAARQGLSFALGRGRVTVIGPTRTLHTDEADDGLSLRIDYGQTSVLIMGGVSAVGEGEILRSGVNVRADALICAQGGGEGATSLPFVQAVSPRIAVMTGGAANSVRVRLQKHGAQVYTMEEHGVMTLRSDGQTLEMIP